MIFFHQLRFLYSFYLLFYNNLWGLTGCGIYVLFKSEHFTVTVSYSLYVAMLCVTGKYITVYFTQNFHRWSLRDAIINGYNDTRSQFNIMSIEQHHNSRVFFKVYRMSSHRFLVQQYWQIWISSCGLVFGFNQKVIRYPHEIHSNIATVWRMLLYTKDLSLILT